MDYFREFYKMYIENENLLADVDISGSENHQMERRIHSISDFYDSTLIPLMKTEPHKLIHQKQMEKLKIKMQKIS